MNSLIAGAPVDRLLDHAQIEQHVVQVAVFKLDDVVPDGGLDDQRGRPREDHDGARELAALELLIEHHRHDEAKQRGQAHNRDHPDNRVHHDRAEDGIGNRVLEIGQAHEAAHDARLGDLAEGELEDDANGEDDEDRHDEDTRQQPEIRLPLVPNEDGIQDRFPPFSGAAGLAFGKKEGGRSQPTPLSSSRFTLKVLLQSFGLGRKSMGLSSLGR